MSGFARHPLRRSFLPIALLLIAGASHGSCGSAFCSVNTHWNTQGLANAEGLALDLRYSQARADQLRAGSLRISPDAPSGSDG